MRTLAYGNNDQIIYFARAHMFVFLLGTNKSVYCGRVTLEVLLCPVVRPIPCTEISLKSQLNYYIQAEIVTTNHTY